MPSDLAPAAISPTDAGTNDGTTLATIEVIEPDGSTTTVPNITAFSYSCDAQQVGDPFAVTVPDPRLRYLREHKLCEGSRVTFSLASPFVGGGAKTKKITGVLVRREVQVDATGGTVMQLQGADNGWHLINNDGVLWMGLQGKTLGSLGDACIHPERVIEGELDPRWGFADQVLFENVSNTLAKQHLKQGRQGIVIANQANPEIPLARIQVEPGQKLFDMLSLYSKRQLLFVNVTAEGALVFYSPDYSRDPSYEFRCYPIEEPDSVRNNVLGQGIKVFDDITERFTDVTCVGEVPLPDETDGVVAKDDINANKFRGRYTATQGSSVAGLRIPPFLRRLVFGEGEALYRGMADNRAAWRALYGLFNSHVVTFSVRHHHQRGIWYEANTMCTLDFPVVGVSGRYYISAVRCDRDDRGDRTQITAHKPDLLAA